MHCIGASSLYIKASNITIYMFLTRSLFASRAVTDSINMLLNACMSAAPGQKECDNALRNIQVGTVATATTNSASTILSGILECIRL